MAQTKYYYHRGFSYSYFSSFFDYISTSGHVTLDIVREFLLILRLKTKFDIDIINIIKSSSSSQAFLMGGEWVHCLFLFPLVLRKM